MLVAEKQDPLNTQNESHVASGSSRPRPPSTLHDPFVFVPITQSEAARGRGAAKRIVRAHVTRVQHAKSSTLQSGMDLQSWTVKPYIPKDNGRGKRKQKSNEEKKRPALLKHDTSTSSSSSGTSSTTLIPQLPTGGGSDDPFWTFPVDYQPALSPILAHYIQNIAVEMDDIDGPYKEKGVLRKVWFPMCMTSAATMYAVLLMAASHYCTVNPSKAALIDLLALKSRALFEINAELAKPDAEVSDAMIGAVAKMAAYEAIFGDSENFEAHMRGLRLMVKLKGGLPKLGLNGLLERMLVWIDLNACHLTGHAVHFGDNELPTVIEFDGPNPYAFAGIK